MAALFLRIVITTVVVLMAVGAVSAFSGLHHRELSPTAVCNRNRKSYVNVPTCLFVMDPFTWTSAISGSIATLEPVTTAGIALVSAAAGAASALPRIHALEEELIAAQEALNATEAAYQKKLEALEEALFQFDREYETQSAKLKQEWDRQKVNEMNALQKKLQEELQYKLSLEVEKERSKVLTQTAMQWNGASTDKAAQLMEMRMKASRLESSQQELEKALQDSVRELERFQAAAADASKKKFFGLF